MARFKDLSIILTGAGGGFGRRTAERLSQEGARLILSDRDEKALAETAGQLKGDYICLEGDVAAEAHHQALVDLAVKNFGRLDIALNNAGIAQSFVKLPDVTTEEARRIIDIDLMGVFYAMKAQLPQMEKQFRAGGKGGSIVNTASVAGLAGAPKLSVYSAAKHGVVGLTRSAAAEYARAGIRVNAICPSFARTRMVSDMVDTGNAGEDEALANLTRGVPMRRVAEIDEIVEAILFAADPNNSFMTGQALAIDGGITAL
jgi:NAD(P)-dependent dehydrogenase (short-subunit alcohol dehydrogenase family)